MKFCATTDLPQKIDKHAYFEHTLAIRTILLFFHTFGTVFSRKVCFFLSIFSSQRPHCLLAKKWLLNENSFATKNAFHPFFWKNGNFWWTVVVFISLCGPKRVNICKKGVGAMGRGERGVRGRLMKKRIPQVSCQWGCMGVP